MEKSVIAAARRSAIGAFGGALKDLTAAQIAQPVLETALTDAGVSRDAVDEVIMGCILQAGLGQNIARQIAVNAGIPVGIPALTLNQVCGSGLRAVSMAAQTIAAGDNHIVAAGGVESMSRAPYLLGDLRWGGRMGNLEAGDSILSEALTDAFQNIHMGVTAENIAQREGISRAEQDDFAALSQQKAEAAIKAGIFRDEIVPLTIPQKKGDPVVFDTDEHPRFGTTAEKLGKLKPAFKKDGTVTAGNASGINDGTAVLIVMSESKARALGVRPMAEIVSYASTGVEPAYMGMGPVDASRAALKKGGLSKGDIDLFELNEAFAAQSIAVVRALGLDSAKVNVNGGAIALGHPVGASGARILTTLLWELLRRKKTYGLASLCVGGGMGVTVVVRSLR